MFISIITPSKNQGQYIKHCLDSIYSQSHATIEHIVIDGLSTDITSEMVASYPSVFIQRKDSGPAQAINRGLDMATGEIVCWLNADDAFAGPEVLTFVADMFRRHPELDVITGDGYYIDDLGLLISPIAPDRKSNMSHASMRRDDIFLQPATFWRRNDFRLDERMHFAFDWQLWLDFYAAGLNIRYVPECFALYRIHPGSLTQKDPPLRRQELYNIIARHGDSKIQRAWCWIIWKGYALDNSLRTGGLRKVMRLLNRLLHRLSAGRLSSPGGM